MPKLTLNDIVGDVGTSTAHNVNSALIEAAIENTLSRDGTTPNIMLADLDMNSFDINNIAQVRTAELYIAGEKVQAVSTLNSLGDLIDVDVVGAGDGNSLVYNITSGNWEASVPVATLNDLTDTDLTGLLDNQYLQYNLGTGNWEPVNLVAGDVFKVGTPVDNQLAVWTGDGTIEGTSTLTYDGTYLKMDDVAPFGMMFTNTSSSTNAKKFSIGNLLGIAGIRFWNDAESSNTELITWQRSGTNVTTVDHQGNTFRFFPDTSDGGFQITHDILTLGDTLSGAATGLRNPLSSHSMKISGGSNNFGSSLQLFGSSHANANDIILGHGTNVTVWDYDYSTGTSTFWAGSGTTNQAFQIDTNGIATFFNKAIFDASTTANPSINIPEGVAPSAPVDGDVWVTAAGEFFARLNGVSVDLAAGGGGGVTASGTPVDNQLAVWTTASAIEGEPSLTFNNANDRFTVGAGAAGAASPQIDINAQATGVPTLGFLQAGVTMAGISYVDADDMLAIQSDFEIEFRPGNVGDWGIFSTTSAKLGNYTFNTDQTVGAGQDNYVLTYDNASGEILLEPATGGGGSIGGTITDNQVAVGATTANDIEGTSQLTFDSTASLPVLTVNSDATGSPSIHLNQNAVNKALIRWQQTGTYLNINSDNDIQLRSGNALALTLDASQNATFVGNITSLGIDDNATAERIQIADTNMVYGASATTYAIINASSTNELFLSGGSTQALGGNLIFYPETHATLAGDIRIRSGSNNLVSWDESAGSFAVNTGTGAKTQALLLDSSQNATFAGTVDVSGANIRCGVEDTLAGNLTLYGGPAAGNEGGQINLKTSADHDTIIDFWSLDAYQDDFRIGAAGVGTALTLDSNRDAIFAGAVDVQGTDVTITNASTPFFKARDTTNTVDSVLQATDTTGLVGTTTNHPFEVRSNNTAAITIDTSQNSTFAGTIVAPAATTSIPSIRLPHGSAPTTPTNGDMWTTTSSAFVRINGVTQDLLGGGSFTLEDATDVNAYTHTNQQVLVSNGTAFALRALNINDVNSDIALKTGTNTWTNAQTFQGRTTFQGPFSRDDDTLGTTGTINVDFNATSFFHTGSLGTGAVTFTFSNAPSGPTTGEFFMIMHNAANPSSITWPANMRWPAGTEPTWTAGADLIKVMTYDGSANYWVTDVTLNMS